MKCSLIICTFNWPEALKLVLSSVNLQSELPDEIIVADDGSDKNTENVIKEFVQKSPIPIIHSWQEDIGCRIPHSRNRAISKSNFEYIIMIDGDTILHNHFVSDHKKFARKKLYLQGSRVLLQSSFSNNLLKNNQFKKPIFFSRNTKNKLNTLRIPILAKMLSFFKTQNINRIRGCNYSVFKEDIFAVNGFNEEISLWGREDSEFAQRLFNNGLKKQHLKFAAIQYHLFHNERSHSRENDNILNDTIKKNSKWCQLGIDSYL
jgi:glycosyltransferase involved in cell wall biosynthesis